jgi:hypothetical protein
MNPKDWCAMGKYIEDYKVPTEEELKTFTIEQAEQIDNANAETARRNRQLVEGAKKILMEVEPENRRIRMIEVPVPPVKYAYILRQLRDKEREMEETSRLNAAKVG